MKWKILKLLLDLLYNNNEAYCESCKKYTANENSSVKKTKQDRLMLLSNCAVCGKKNSTFIKKKELSND